jgi:uncharacterized iron-regulated protein
MKEWQELQRKLYRQIRKDIKELIQKRPASLENYEKIYKEDFKALNKIPQSQLVKSINRSDFLFIGDFHTLRQSQKLVLRLLRDRQIKKPKAIAFEILKKSHLKVLQAWLRSPTAKAEQKLRHALLLEPVWRAHWENFRDIFQYCHSKNIKILPLGSNNISLKARDQFAAKELAKSIAPTWVLFGEFHCARAHIPKLLQKAQPLKKLTVLQQNTDHLSLRLLNELSPNKSMVLKAKPLKISKGSEPIELFSLLHTPLWLKWQSYLERQLKRSGSFGESEELVDLQDQINWSLKTLFSFLKDPRYPKKRSLEDILDVSVFGPEDKLFYSSLSKLDPKLKKQALDQLRSSGIATLADSRRIYLSEFTVNSCAQAAGAYLYRVWTRSSPAKSDFYQYTLSEALGFFLSKILNHSRRATHLNEWQRRTKSHPRSKEAKAVVKAYSFSESFKAKKIFPSPHSPLRIDTAVHLGRMIADLAFEAFLAGEFSQQRLIRLVSHAPKTELEAFEILVELKSVGQSFHLRSRKAW